MIIGCDSNIASEDEINNIAKFPHPAHWKDVAATIGILDPTFDAINNKMVKQNL